MRLFDRVRELRLAIDRVELEPHALSLKHMTRRTTVVHLHGAGHEGVGEDVSYEEDLQLAFTDDALPPLAGEHTVETFSELVAGQPGYRPWGLESAALDLALRQAGLSLADAVGREPKPVRFVVSQSAVREWRELYPEIRFKLDASDKWTDEVVAELAATGAVDVVDLKGLYEGEWVDATPSAELYSRVADAFPDAWLEDARLTDETRPVLEPHRDRLTWDFPIHSVADVDALEWPPRCLNSKPSRFGSVRNLFDFYDACGEREIALYGGGQFELGPGRAQIQHLASLFHADAPNDVAPKEYNDGGPRPGLPQSPLPPASAEPGFR
ncbi:MAG: hypothetical protein QOF45_1245 [Gaiellaceae bacterium]|jgi:hypothetical protein|nr:hypothetical protein [Gaiellaceae bacterium]